MNKELTAKGFAKDFPDNSRIWIYGSDRILQLEEAEQIDQAAKKFIGQWTAHQMPLRADAAVLHQCFLILAVDESSVSASGCSIDRSVHFVKEIALKYKVDFFNRFLIYVLKDEEIFIHKWKELWLLKEKGQINETDKVFNIWTTRLSEWRHKQLIPLSESPARPALLSTTNEISFTL